MIDITSCSRMQHIGSFEMDAKMPINMTKYVTVPLHSWHSFHHHLINPYFEVQLVISE